VLGLFRPWAPDAVVDTIASMSFLTRFDGLSRGVIELRDLVFFLSLIAFWLFATTMVVDAKKAG
jgi:ABC-2 type transport system permease protein